MKVSKYYCDRCGKEISDIVARLRKVQIQQTEVHLCYKCSDEVLDAVHKRRTEMQESLCDLNEA